MRFIFLVLFSLTIRVAVGDEPMLKRTFAAELGMEFMKIPGGSFTMGSNETTADLEKAEFVFPEGYDIRDESPARTVRMAAFRMRITEVPRREFAEFVRSTNYDTDAEKDAKGGIGFNNDIVNFEKPPEIQRATWWFPAN